MGEDLRNLQHLASERLPENADNVRRFLGQIGRGGGTKLAWEPRGSWREHPEEIRKLCHQLDLIHAVDILRPRPAVERQTCYFRLHGLGPKEFNYRYNYSAEDLRRLREAAIETLTTGAEEVFILFNNLSMLKDARTFDKMMRETQSPFVSGIDPVSRASPILARFRVLGGTDTHE